MYQVIARKYRPQYFSELIGQEHVRTTLENAIQQRRIAHGYIFAGQRGTGKTTVARILARCLNCVEGPTAQPCGKCASCLEIAAGNAPDVIEIDAASNRGINEMRELRENVRYRPARDRYKVFIIDEAHQITNEAFNALLKTLEEPPEWAVFVMCTTEAHKIPTTIASRCQQFTFRSVEFPDLVARMEWICAQEGISADAEALSVLAQAGEGSVRDSLSALDQAIACYGGTLAGQQVRELLGMFSLESMSGVTRALAESSTTQMLEIVNELELSGRNLQHFCRELSRYFRNLMVAKITGEDTRLIAASAAEQARLRDVAGQFSEEDLTRYFQLTVDVFGQLQYSLQPRLHLELGLLRLVHAGRMKPVEEALKELSGAPQPAKAPVRSASVQSRAGTSPFQVDSARKTQTAAPPAKEPLPDTGGTLKERLLGVLHEAGSSFLADAVEHAEVVENGATVLFTAPKEFHLALKDKELLKFLQRTGGRPVKVQVSEGAGVAAAERPAEGGAKSGDEVSERALAHPEVKRFQERFKDSQVRGVRDLKE
ncbi:MAG: DNA polymerase III subunit gamma/tau [Bryobacterales bacterium]|nr:DNA polymerase III subunit gamma/tau [Bryobacterales bacterium]